MNISFLEKNEKKLLLALFGLAAILYLLSLNNYFWLDGDDVVYSILARSILKGEYLNYHNILNTPNIFYWPGFPILLTIPTLIFGNNIIALKFIPILCTLIALLFLFKYFKLKYGLNWAFIILILLIINPVIFTFAHTILTQAPFLMSLIFSIYYIEKTLIEKKSHFSKEFLIGTFFAIFSKYVRPEGDFLALFVFIYLILNKKFKHAIIFSFFFIVLTGFWHIQIHRMYNNASPIQKEYFMPLTGRIQNILRKSLVSDKVEILTFKEIIDRTIEGWKFFFTENIPVTIFGFKFMQNQLFWGLIISFLMIFGFILSLKSNSLKEILKNISIMHLYTLFGLALAILAVGKSEKYLYPVIPFIIFFIFQALKKLPKFLFVLIFIVFSLFSITLTLENLSRERQKPYYDPYFETYLELAKWCKNNTPANAKFITRKSEYFYWYSNRKGAPILYKEPEENLKYIYKLDADFLTVTYTGFDGISNPFVSKLLNQYPQFFKVYHYIVVPGTNLPYYVLKIEKEALKKYVNENLYKEIGE